MTVLFATIFWTMGVVCGLFMTFIFDETETKQALDHKIAMKIKGDLKFENQDDFLYIDIRFTLHSLNTGGWRQYLQLLVYKAQRKQYSRLFQRFANRR